MRKEFFLLGAVARVEKRRPLPQRRIRWQLGEVGIVFFERFGDTVVGLIAHLLQRHDGKAQQQDRTLDKSADQTRPDDGVQRRNERPIADRQDERRYCGRNDEWP